MNTHTIGDVTYPPGGTFETRDLNCFQVFVMGAGSCVITAEGEPFKCDSGSIFMMYPKTHYLLQFDKQTACTHYWVALFDYSSQYSKLKLLNNQTVIIKQNPVLQDYMKLCLRLRDTSGFELAEFSFVNQYVETLTDYILQMNKEKSRFNNKVLIALNFIRTRYSDNLNLSVLAEQVHCSPEHLSRLFKQSGLNPPMNYLKEFRLNKALYLIKETSLSFKEIGQQVGIPDPFQFSKSVKYKCGVSPRELRIVGQQKSL